MANPVVGSGLFTNQGALVPHRMSKEVADLRADISRTLFGLANIVVAEYLNPAGADTDAILLAKTCTLAAQTYAAAALDGVVGDDAMPFGRNITVTTSGGTAADAPATLTVTGVGRDLTTVITEDISVPQTVTTAVGAKIFYKVTGLALTVGQGTDAAVEVGFGSLLGLPYKALLRAAVTAPLPIREILDTGYVTNGVLNATNNSYAPNTVPNGTHDYCLYYEADPTVVVV